MRVKRPEVTVSIIEELIRRDGIKAAVAGRDEKNLDILVRFLARWVMSIVWSVLGGVLSTSGDSQLQVILLKDLLYNSLTSLTQCFIYEVNKPAGCVMIEYGDILAYSERQNSVHHVKIMSLPRNIRRRAFCEHEINMTFK